MRFKIPLCIIVIHFISFQGLAGGTLFYITFFEVLDKEKLSRGGMSGLLGFCFIFAGFAIMAAVNAMGECMQWECGQSNT